eukprot:COSAG01_NODE_1993_length_8694_cov_3.220826_2_plen_109_part_00
MLRVYIIYTNHLAPLLRLCSTPPLHCILWRKPGRLADECCLACLCQVIRLDGVQCLLEAMRAQPESETIQEGGVHVLRNLVMSEDGERELLRLEGAPPPACDNWDRPS